jgi:hypothetical protein
MALMSERFLDSSSMASSVTTMVIGRLCWCPCSLLSASSLFPSSPRALSTCKLEKSFAIFRGAYSRLSLRPTHQRCAKHNTMLIYGLRQSLLGYGSVRWIRGLTIYGSENRSMDLSYAFRYSTDLASFYHNQSSSSSRIPLVSTLARTEPQSDSRNCSYGKKRRLRREIGDRGLKRSRGSFSRTIIAVKKRKSDLKTAQQDL